ncbi:MAG: glycoside hydrolase family 38 C-terminal domain-containing protein [Gemmatimonadales bacterium]
MSGVVFHLIAHTHWDREWYLPRAAFGVRLVEVLDDLIERLERDAALRSFLLDGQTVLLEDYLRARPDREADVRALVKTGRLQVGPWYVLADEQIPCGESLIRNLLAGLADAERLGGRLDVLYSPDAFGHPGVLPSLAREFGLRAAVVWRGLGGEPGQERDTYRWRAPDGRDVVLWHLPPAGYEVGAALPAEGDALAAAWAPVRAMLIDRAATKHIPVFVGADHRAAHPAIGRLRERLAELEPDNAVRVSRLDEFFQAVAAVAETAPLLEGELRWSYRYTWTLQGVHGTRAHQKRRHALAELWLARFAEPLAALARRGGGRDRRPQLDVAWRELLRAQFHDALGGCASDAVALAVDARLGAVEAAGREIVRLSLHDLVGHDPDRRGAGDGAGPVPTLVLWNPAARARGGVTVADVTWFRRDVVVGPGRSRRPPEGAGYRPFAFAGPDGRAIPVQVLGRWRAYERLDAARRDPDQDEVDVVRVAFRAPPVAGCGAAILTTTRPSAVTPAGDGAAVKGRALLNRFVEVTLEPSGALVLLDRGTREWFLDLLSLEDEGDAGDTYTFAPAARGRAGRHRGPLRLRRLAAGPLVAAVEARFATPGGEARLVVMVHADSPAVRCVLEVDNLADNHRLRARLPLNLSGVPALAGAAFGAVTRPAVAADPRDYPLETPVRTAPAHRFVAAADGNRGLALLAPGFFEYEWTADGTLLFTVTRALGELSRDDLPTRPGHAGWPVATPLAQCPGRHRVELALVPLGGNDLARSDHLERVWEDVFLPVRGFWLRQALEVAPPAMTLMLEGDGLVFSAAKPARVGSGLVLRCYNATGRRTAGTWRFGEGVRAAHRVRADERDSQELVVENRGRTVRFAAEPHEIVTILIT